MTAVLARSDFLRTPILAAAQPDGFKEWHHFVIHGHGVRILINFSLNNEVVGANEARLAPRVIVIASGAPATTLVVAHTSANAAAHSRSCLARFTPRAPACQL